MERLTCPKGMKMPVWWAAALFLGCFLAGDGVGQRAHALGQETVGFETLSEVNYAEWKGILPLVNDPGRTYHNWVNGNEHFFYLGDTDAANLFLKSFARVEGVRKAVILKDEAPPVVTTWIDKTPIAYGWKLHLLGGIAREVIAEDKGIAPADLPVVMTIYLKGNGVERERISIPRGIEILEGGPGERTLKAAPKADPTTKTLTNVPIGAGSPPGQTTSKTSGR